MRANICYNCLCLIYDYQRIAHFTVCDGGCEECSVCHKDNAVFYGRRDEIERAKRIKDENI